MKAKRNVSGDVFNYGLFRVDVISGCKKSKVTLEELSQKKFFRAKGFLSNALNNESLPLNIIIELCDMFGLSVRTYENHNDPAPMKAASQPDAITVSGENPLVFHITFGGKLYTCETKFNKDFGCVVTTLSTNGNPVETGKANYHDDTLAGIINSIGYSFHQLELRLRGEDTRPVRGTYFEGVY